MTEKATISKVVVYIALRLFNVRPFSKIDKPQDENEGNRKMQLSITNNKNPVQSQKDFRNECCKRYVADLHSITQDFVNS